MPARMTIDRERLADVCRRYHIRSLALFGSVLRDDFRPDSDVDVLAEFDPDAVIGFAIYDLEEELRRIFAGHHVDIVSRRYLNRRLHDRVLGSAELQHAEG